MASKQSIIIIGSGWAGSTLSNALDESKFSITIISPETTTPYTPLLASAACGLYDLSIVETPVRRTGKKANFIKAVVEGIDFKAKTVQCSPAFPDQVALPVEKFEMEYDVVVIAPGCINQTFGTPGVSENALFLRTARDAQTVAERIKLCFEKASIPGLTPTQQRALLHFIIVGAGPTGIEVSSELSDLCSHSYAALYPHLASQVSIAIHDVASSVLNGFDSKLQAYAMKSFSRRGVQVLTGSHIERVEKDAVYTKEQGRIETGCVLWATGNKTSPLVETLDVKKTPRNPRILTDSYLRVLSPSASSPAIEGAYALGDAADVEDERLPTTAEVACQKATYLAKSLNRGFETEFSYEQTPLVAYLGMGDGVVSGKRGRDYEGRQAWLAWRSKNFLWTRTWRQKILIVVAWILNLITGLAIAPQ